MSDPLARHFQRIARDRTSGAAELALHAVAAIEGWLRRHPNPPDADLEDLVVRLLHLHPSMAPLLRLANDVALAADSGRPGPALSRAVRSFRHCLQDAPRRIAKLFSAELADGLAGASSLPVVLFSYSSTVVAAVSAARRRISTVLTSECRPGMEGLLAVSKLAKAGFQVQLATDAGLLSLMQGARVVVVGADAVLSRAFVNKIGTRALYLRAREAGCQFWVLTDSTKLLPEAIAAPFWRPSDGPPSEVWPHPTRRVHVLNPLFEHTELGDDIRVLTEAGWLDSAQVREAIDAIRTSPRLKRLAD
jgi:translation initiation factor 2B subunit (eIF-2B alpha/beta/delta family)